MKSVLEHIHNNPLVLTKVNPNLVAFLQSQGKSTSQGRGNSVNHHEACFAEVLEQHGFVFLTKKEVSTESYYKHQPNGTQKSPDFEVYDKQSNKTFLFDLKHSTKTSLFLNDGWFEPDIIYVCNWTTRKKPKILIAYGRDIRTEEECEKIKEINALKNQFNQINKKCGSLRIYARFANQYVCNKFTDKYLDETFKTVLKSLTQ